MSKKTIKPQIRQHMHSNFPQYEPVDDSRKNLTFQRIGANWPSEFIGFQIDYKFSAIAVSCATTYNSLWEGEPARPLGIDAGMADIKQKSRVVNALDQWYFSCSGSQDLESLLKLISRDIKKHVLPYMAKLKKELSKDRILQFALDIAPNHLAGREKFMEDLQQCHFVIREVKNETFERFLEEVDSFTRANRLSEDGWIERIVCDILYFGVEKGGSD